MKKWIVRFVSLWVFNVVVLFVIGLIIPAVNVGWSAIWGGIILTAATLWLKPLFSKLFSGMSAKSAAQRTKAGEKTVQYASVFVVALIVWLVTVWFTGVNVRDLFWGYLLPPIILLIGWAIYDAIDDKVEAKAGALYDKATGKSGVDAVAPATDVPLAPANPAAEAARRELNDGLTDEQRRMLDDLT